ncbi:MAG: site-specific DNA-methyltransferase [Cyanothece sp. SIO2G6]|nr:site-specific DNA-methyltransferase [Cyanothece sp. SIO2G6]
MPQEQSDLNENIGFSLERLPNELQEQFRSLYIVEDSNEQHYLVENNIYQGDARAKLQSIRANSISLSFWSPPYFVGKKYEEYLDFEKWKLLLSKVISLHFRILKPGGFLVINIADILVFKDEKMPRIQADLIHRKRVKITRDDVLKVMAENPNLKRHEIAKILGCSEQTVDRRLHGNNIRGGKNNAQTRIQLTGGLIEKWCNEADFYMYDRRTWVKDPAWENSKWHSSSYRSVDEFEYLYFLWKPGVLRFDRSRLSKREWREWGSRGVWHIPSVRVNDDHEAKFPEELPKRIIRLLTDPGETVLDCFMGSGTTAVAAIKEKRKFIGVELNAKYVELSKKKINNVQVEFPYE